MKRKKYLKAKKTSEKLKQKRGVALFLRGSGSR
jgi:hypothetical protein